MPIQEGSVVFVLGTKDEPWLLVTDKVCKASDDYVSGFWLQHRPGKTHKTAMHFVKWSDESTLQWRGTILDELYGGDCCNTINTADGQVWVIPMKEWDEAVKKQQWERGYWDGDSSEMVVQPDSYAEHSSMCVSEEDMVRFLDRLQASSNYADKVSMIRVVYT